VEDFSSPPPLSSFSLPCFFLYPKKSLSSGKFLSSGADCSLFLGIYDSCYFAGDYAKSLCPNRNLGTIPAGRVCPSNNF
jgi:hypothetical protein